VESCQYGRTTSPELAAQFRAADERVLGPIRGLLGLGEASSVSSGAAPLPPLVAAFLAGLGMMILDVYGMTETTGAFTANTHTEFKLGTVGRPAAGIEVRIAEDGEILARGPLTTPGYQGRPDLTDALIDDNGWLRTGDLGAITPDGFLAITGRKKDLIITSSGKNISPVNIENELRESRFITEAVVFGDSQPYLVAMLTLDSEESAKLAHRLRIAPDPATIATDPRIHAEIRKEVDAVNAKLARIEQVKRFAILDHDLSQAAGELTPTLKVKRAFVYEKYADLFAGLYQEGGRS